MAKGARRLGHAEQKEQKYMELLAEQLGVITALVAKMDAITSSQRLEDAIDVKSDVTRELSEKNSVKNQPIAEDGAKTSSTGNQVKNDSTAKSNVTNDLTGKAKPRNKVRKRVFEISIAAFWACIFAPYADSIRTTMQVLLWKGIEFAGFPASEILRLLATFWIL